MCPSSYTCPHRPSFSRPLDICTWETHRHLRLSEDLPPFAGSATSTPLRLKPEARVPDSAPSQPPGPADPGAHWYQLHQQLGICHGRSIYTPEISKHYKLGSSPTPPPMEPVGKHLPAHLLLLTVPPEILFARFPTFYHHHLGPGLRHVLPGRRQHARTSLSALSSALHLRITQIQNNSQLKALLGSPWGLKREVKDLLPLPGPDGPFLAGSPCSHHGPAISGHASVSASLHPMSPAVMVKAIDHCQECPHHLQVSIDCHYLRETSPDAPDLLVSPTTCCLPRPP